MRVDLFAPSKKQVEDAKNAGIDLISALKYIAGLIMKDTIEGKTKKITIDVREGEYERLQEYGVDMISHCVNTYRDEINRLLDQEWMQNYKEVVVELKGDESDSNVIKDVLTNIDVENWTGEVVTSTSVASVIQDLCDFEPVKFSYDSIGKIYEVGTYRDAKIFVDPYMPWKETKILFIKSE